MDKILLIAIGAVCMLGLQQILNTQYHQFILIARPGITTSYPIISYETLSECQNNLAAVRKEYPEFDTSCEEATISVLKRSW